MSIALFYTEEYLDPLETSIIQTVGLVELELLRNNVMNSLH